MPLHARLRLLALALAAVTLAPVASGPPCSDPASCPMDQTQAAGTCDGLSSDCCQAAAERTSSAPALPALVQVACASPLDAAAPAHGAAALARFADHPPPLAAGQDIGLHTLLSVFLI